MHNAHHGSLNGVGETRPNIGYTYQGHRLRTAKRFGLRYEGIPGSNTLIKKMLHGPWDDEFIVARPSETISYLEFKRTKSKT